MFRKIVSNLPFSPALVGQLGFYAKRLRKEETTRRLGLIVTALALVMQSFAVFSPPEAANASSSADFVRGGVSSVQEFLQYYDRNHNNIKSIYDSLGIKRSEITKAKRTVIGEQSRYNWSMTSLYSYAQGQRSWNYGSGTAFYRPMRLTQQGGDRHAVFASYSKSMGWFAIKIDCGNLVTQTPPNPPKPVASCQNLAVTRLSPTRFKFFARANTKDGAKIKAFVYNVKRFSKNEKTIRSNSSKTTDTVTYSQSKPGTYHVYLTVKTSLGDKNDPDCRGKFTVQKEPKEPAAECKSVQASIQDRTIVSLTGSSTTQNGATIKKYVFVVRNKSGKVVKKLTVNSSKRAVNAPSFTLSKDGAYTVTLAVHTSEGVKKDDKDCVKKFTIVPPENCPFNPNLPLNSPDCQPCPENPEVWIKDESCSSEIINTKTATNVTQGNVNATTKQANAGDKISYTVTVSNSGLVSENVVIKESLKDVLEYANLIDDGAGVFDKNAQTLTWPEAKVEAGGKQSRTFTVQMMEKIPLTNTGKSDEASYDCRIVNTFGNSVEINVNCPQEKVIVEQVVNELPRTGPRENMIFAAVLFAVVAYFYARSRQLGKEVKLIRKNVHAGTI
jgi:uncharacterized repeat protein (TIGR01451 family)